MDLIERQAAIDAMKDTFKGTMVGTRVAVDAINRLPSAEPNLQLNLQPTCNQLATDCISRKDAIDAIDGLPNCYNGYSDSYDKSYIIGVLEELPSAEPKTGKWILSFNGYENTWICSECGVEYVLYDGTIAEQHYCPNCGAKMEVEDD